MPAEPKRILPALRQILHQLETISGQHHGPAAININGDLISQAIIELDLLERLLLATSETVANRLFPLEPGLISSLQKAKGQQ